MLADFAAHCGGWLPAARILAEIADQFDGDPTPEAVTMSTQCRRDSLICLMQAVTLQRLAGVAQAPETPAQPILTQSQPIPRG